VEAEKRVGIADDHRVVGAAFEVEIPPGPRQASEQGGFPVWRDPTSAT
jgi:hypothetical protein